MPNVKMLAFALQVYIGFVLFQGASMKSIQNSTDHDISIASLKSTVDHLNERIESMTVIQTQGKIFYNQRRGDNRGDQMIKS
jgi:hypothetical protein